MLTTHPKKPEQRTMKQAADALEVIQGSQAMRGHEDVEVTLGEGVEVKVPREAFDMFVRILGQLANGQRVMLTPMHAMLTTQQAADLLSVSRPYLIGLLERGELRHTKVGRHRRIKYEDLMDYKQARESEELEALASLVELSQLMDA